MFTISVKRVLSKAFWQFLGHSYNLVNIAIPVIILMRSIIGVFDNILWGPEKGLLIFFSF